MAVQASRMKLAAGDLVPYSGRSVHKVEPVKRGECLACFFWIASMLRLDEQRQLRYDMNLAITVLKQKVAGADQTEGEKVIQLTCCHHNLLRK